MFNCGFAVSFFFFHFWFAAEKVVPEIELAFAISATGVEADETYRLMRDTLKSIIDEYGSKQIDYSVILYGSSAEQKIRFDQNFSSDDALKASIDKIGRATGSPALVDTLEEAKKLFQDSSLRPKAIKVCCCASSKCSIAENMLYFAERVKRRNTRLL